MNSPMPHLFIPAHGLAAAWIAMAFGVDLLVYADSAWLIIAITGLFLGQSCMVMLWAVCGPQSPRMRWLVGLLALGALWIALNLGDFCMKGRSFDFLNTVLHLPGVFIAMQLPLWVVKLAWGHQIVPDPAASEEPAWVRRRLTIGDLILITTVLAGSLALRVATWCSATLNRTFNSASGRQSSWGRWSWAHGAQSRSSTALSWR